MIRLRGLNLSTIGRLLVAPKGRPSADGPVHCFLCVADHHEPMVGAAAEYIQRERVERWVREYPRSVDGIADSRGRPPQQTFFYPIEEYNPWHVEKLAGICRRGLGEVEVHLHHDNDTADHLRETLERSKERLFGEHGLLAKDERGRITYGFVHGDWALNNSHPEGRHCGVNNEMTVLRETGCYADFTMPSAPSPTQTRTINSIYYAVNDPLRPKSHDRGTPACSGKSPPENELLLIQGPLILNWSGRKFGFLPGLENADLHGGFPPNLRRLRLWLRAGVSVVGRPDWVFVKLHTHGAPERNAAMLLGEPMRRFHEDLADFARENSFLRYYYVTAREMADLVHQAERGAAEPRIGPQSASDAPFMPEHRPLTLNAPLVESASLRRHPQSPSVARAAKTTAKWLLYFGSVLTPPRRRKGNGRCVAFFFHRAIDDHVPRDDWTRILGHPTVSEIRRKLRYLMQYCQFVTLTRWLELLQSREPFDNNYAALTVDDGYRDFRTHLMPLLEELNIPVAFFVCSGAVETRWVWYDKIYRLITAVTSHRLQVPWLDMGIPFGNVHQRVDMVEHALLPYLKRLSPLLRHRCVSQLLEANDVRPAPCDLTTFCDVEDLRALRESALVEIYPHGHWHNPFETLTDDELRLDLAASRTFFREKLGLEPKAIAYPNGCFNARQRGVLESLGFRYGFTTTNDFEQPGSIDAFALPRTGFGGESMADFTYRLRRLGLLRRAP